MMRDQGRHAGGALISRQNQQRRMTRWIASAVWRHKVARDSLTAATVVSDALDALGVGNRVTLAGAVLDCPTLPASKQFGLEALVVASDAGLLVDAGFDRFGTRIPYLVAPFEHERDAWVQQVGSATVTFLPSSIEPEVPDEQRALVMAQGLEVAGVGSHVEFDQDALLYAEHAIFPSWTRLKAALDDVEGDAAHRLAAFRASRNDHLVELGYPYSLEDPFLPPLAAQVAA